MRELFVDGQCGRSRIMVGPLEALLEEGMEPPSVVVVDSNVRRLHPRHFRAGYDVIEVEGGEKCKSLDGLERLYREFLAKSVDRGGHVLIVGGGTVCDLAAFAASTYMRGVAASLVPTTLLAQVDAGVGGKNGINFGGYKNIVGTIAQPHTVLCDSSFLSTLPLKSVRDGYAEIIKHAAIADAEYFSFLQANVSPALSLDPGVMERVLFDSLVIKTGIVSRDERESGERMKLNFGHTVGHAVESVLHVSHGQAVSIGMAVEARLSERRGTLSADEYSSLANLLAAYGLPTELEGNAQELKSTITSDKKRRGREIVMPILEGLGRCRTERVPVREVEDLIDALCFAE